MIASSLKYCTIKLVNHLNKHFTEKKAKYCKKNKSNYKICE